jgi:hypothetical protein
MGFCISNQLIWFSSKSVICDHQILRTPLRISISHITVGMTQPEFLQNPTEPGCGHSDFGCSHVLNSQFESITRMGSCSCLPHSIPGAHKIFMKLSGLPEEWLAML